LVPFFRATNVGLADRAGVLALKPLPDAFFVEPMKTWHDYKLITDFIVALADRAHLIFFAEI
jgi:hypothetical protein